MGTYRLVNRILVTALAVFGCVVFVSYRHGDWVCPSIRFAHVPCLLCGCTRDFIDLYMGNLQMRNPLSPWLFCILHAEFAWRLVFSFVPCRKGVVTADAVFHGGMAIPLLFYLAAGNPIWRRLW